MLIVAGTLIGLYCHWAMLAFASFVVLIVRVVYDVGDGHFGIIDILMLAACLSALQGGFIFGGYIAYKRSA